MKLKLAFQSFEGHCIWTRLLSPQPRSTPPAAFSPNTPIAIAKGTTEIFQAASEKSGL